MITKIDINHFGLFEDFNWDAVVSKEETFKKMNIIYGRNYSGKTTLSRIFKCIEDSLIHRDYTDCQFQIILDKGGKVSQTNLHDFSTRHKIRVYNTDFVRENLAWLHREDGTIRPFTILGAKNVDLDKKISIINNRLGNVDKGEGLCFELQQAEISLETLKNANKSSIAALEEKLRRRANDVIKVNDTLFVTTAVKKSYTIADIKEDIDKIGTDLFAALLDEKQIELKVKQLKEIALPDVNSLSETKTKFIEYYHECREILQRQIRPSRPISDLINDSLLQEWVRQGVDLHVNKRTTCGFCGNVLDKDIWIKLDQHFSEESEGLRVTIKNKIAQLENSKKALAEFINLRKDQFYSILQPRFEETQVEWTRVCMLYANAIDELINSLKLREKDIFKTIELHGIADCSGSLLGIIKDFNSIITDHNSKTESLENDQFKVRTELRYGNIARFLVDIDYFKTQTELSKERDRLDEISLELIPKRNEIEVLSIEKRALEAQANDERLGAELINDHLTHFFGHSELKLVTEGQKPNIRFTIQRDGKLASNLSEGECSLISFCYFIAKIEDELKDQIGSQELVIFIDDPISSLDSNHVFFMYSLIETVIAGPKKYGQLFISTHNLEFLKYLKKLTYPKKQLMHFMIERRNKNNSLLKLAPPYLRNYITEFNYLFDQIYQCSLGDREIISNNYRYSFGNNMRKFLEAFMFYKYPTHKKTFEEKMLKYFDNDSVAINLINRVTNEYSHLGEQFERGMEPIEMDEITSISNMVLNRMRITDCDQYDALMDSVNLIA